MIQTCHKAGVGVIVDTIWNHMAAGNSGNTGVGGSVFSHYKYNGIYDYQDFHHDCGTSDGGIKDFKDRKQVQSCELLGLADLATEKENVRDRLAQYAKDLLSLGADGLRLDASKHIPSSDISAILFKIDQHSKLEETRKARIMENVYITQEVIYGDGEPIHPLEYTGNGGVQEFRFTRAVRDAFRYANIAQLRNIIQNNQDWIPSENANIFVANHDTEREGGSLSYKSSGERNSYALATIFLLSFPYGRPTVLSSYQFWDTDSGAPNKGEGSCKGSGGTNGYNCEHRWTAIVGMVGFHHSVQDTPLTDWMAVSPSQISFQRGSSGFVAINSAPQPWVTTFTTTLEDGLYCDVIRGAKLAGGGCSGPIYTVSAGTFSATIPKEDAIAIHVGAAWIFKGGPATQETQS
ncbi:hypothetical protein FRC03_011827 [Tulasnella sp. 419]|nr:hypothetical protein FRC03_011827 [Tulasnella sp. 419]